MIEELLERVTRRLRATAYRSGRRRALGFLTSSVRRRSVGRIGRMKRGGKKTLTRSSYRYRGWRKW